jgi:hypothetical protein
MPFIPFIQVISFIQFIHTTKPVQSYTSYRDTHIKLYKYHWGLRAYEDPTDITYYISSARIGDIWNTLARCGRH